MVTHVFQNHVMAGSDMSYSDPVYPYPTEVVEWNENMKLY